MARTTSRTNRARFSSVPPYSSLRSLIAELRNCVMRYPFAPCSSTPSRPGLARPPGALGEGGHGLGDLRRGHRLAAEPVQRVGLARGREAHRELDAVDVALAPAVAQLHDELAVVLVHGLPHGAPERDVAVVVDHRVVGHDAAAQVHGHERRDDRAHAALGELAFPVDARLVARPVVVVEAPGDVRPEHPVLDRQVLERERLEDRVEGHG